MCTEEVKKQAGFQARERCHWYVIIEDTRSLILVMILMVDLGSDNKKNIGPECSEFVTLSVMTCMCFQCTAVTTGLTFTGFNLFELLCNVIKMQTGQKLNLLVKRNDKIIKMELFLCKYHETRSQI